MTESLCLFGAELIAAQCSLFGSYTEVETGSRSASSVLTRRSAERRKGREMTKPAIVDVTERVLKDLPKAKLSSRAVINGSDTPGVLFELTFAPHSARGRYHRAHALLLGKSRLYHVIYSAPDREASRWDAYTAIVRSLNEEG